MPKALIACHSYTLIKPGTSEKITIKRGQSIDQLDEADRKYLSRQTMTPPSVDDSHLPPMRTPIFHDLVDEDIRGEAQVEPFNLNVDGTAQAAAANQRVEPVQVQVVVSPDAGVTAAASVVDDEDDADEGDEGDAAGDADDGGGAETADETAGEAGGADEPKAAPAAPAKADSNKPKRQSKARNKA